MQEPRNKNGLIDWTTSQFRRNKIPIIALSVLSVGALGWISHGIGFAEAQWWHIAGFVTLALIPMVSAFFVSTEPWGDYSKPPAKIIEALLALGVGLAITFGWRGGVEAYPIAFPVGGVLLLVIFTLVKYLQHESESASQRTLNGLIGKVSKSQQELTHLLNTMPPAQAMTNFKNSYLRTYNLFRSINAAPMPIGDPDRLKDRENALKDGIKMCMNALARLYVQYEHKPLTDECFAHWVRFYSIDDLKADPELLAKAEKPNDYADSLVDPLYNLEGVLHVDPEMTVKVSRYSDDAKTQDTNVQELFLPFPRDNGELDAPRRDRCIPIAPLAFELGRISFPDVHNSINEESAKGWMVNQRVVTNVINYFRNQKNVGSALGYRLSYQIDDSHWEPLGVIIIFTPNPHSKDGEAVTEAYLDICSPFLEMQTDFAFDMVLVQDELRKALKTKAASLDEEAK